VELDKIDDPAGPIASPSLRASSVTQRALGSAEAVDRAIAFVIELTPKRAIALATT
jgi:hypothetical protein